MPHALSPYQASGFNVSDLKTILHSKRANMYYLEYCRVMQKDGRVLYLTEDERANLYYNIPIANTTVILLGTGTSITQAAMRVLAQAGVLVGFCGGGGTPLFAGTEISWLTPQSEYRPTEYVQGWLSWWWDDNKRLQAAKILQTARMDYLLTIWQKDRELIARGFNAPAILHTIETARNTIAQQSSITHLLQHEAHLTKALYKAAASCTKQEGFSREHDGIDKANRFLNHGNYLAYGLGATTAWVLGIPHGFAVMHGKTRRGALVFDIADIIKDALVLPLAFIAAADNLSEQQFRQECLNQFIKHNALDTQFDLIKALALKTDWEAA
ncbi:type I-F CRISPR-associated endonuclease Cas1f [Avibacterium sp. 20-15]|uniref:type I-F CRISPR-associated endonuclease Cas1f n=1 Tax=unclassified Avibacterium TaxID=2685287 RepID=UPI0020275BE6|nr:MULTISPECIES: type I-F CRISPR-associated endonuclease Cas1f [unclassified Avibacterium]MCW9733020.1 type I-F CRISPR-associated endonuclease Cas1f [Avibacterium sp. 20-15]URL05150.1 type I-F CRISPR-associated endonuclease Cas1f [Avibacterium sp. 20-132]